MLEQENQMETMENSDAFEYLQMGQVLMGTQKFNEAIEMFEKTLKDEPLNEVAYISKGIAHASIEEYGKAKECFKRCIMIDKNFAEAYYQLGSMCFLEDDFQEGMKNYNQAIALGYQSADIYFNLALVYEERDEIEEAIRYYSKAANIDETVPDYIIRKATLQIMIGKYEEGLQTLEKVRIRFPEIFEGYHLTAAAYTMLGKYEEADYILQEALKRFPDDMDIIFDRMRVLVTKGDLDEAVLLLADAKQRAVTAEQKKEILLNEAQIQGQLDKLEEADALLIKALEIQKETRFDSEIRYMLMVSYLSQKDFPNMLKIAKQVKKDDISDPYNMCGVYFEAFAMKRMNHPESEKALKDAVRYYRNISMKDPARIDAYLFRAMCYKEEGNFEKAMESIDYMLLIQENNAQLHYIKSTLLREQGKSEEADVELAKAKSLGLNKGFLELVG